MAHPAGRRFLLDTGNEAVAGWSADMASFVGDDLGRDSNRSLSETLGGLRAVPDVGGTGEQVGTLYRELVSAVFANVKDRRDAAAEIVGTMTSFVSQGAGSSVGPFVRDARERLPDGNKAEVTRAFDDLIRKITGQIVARDFWADERVRSKLLAGEPPGPPAKSPPASTPPLEDPPGRLHVPSPDQPAYSVFSDWYDSGDGLPLASASIAAVRSSGVFYMVIW